MVVLLTCKNEKNDPVKNEGVRNGTTFLDFNHMEAICYHGNQSSDSIWPKTLCSLSRTNDAADKF